MINFLKKHLKRILQESPRLYCIIQKCYWYVKCRLSPYEYERELEIIKVIIKRGYFVVDIGTNFGQYALPLSKMVGKRGTVIAFEPVVYSRDILIFNCRGRSNITVYDYALSNIDVGTITLYTPLINGFPNYGETSITEPEGGEHVISEAKVTSLDKAIEQHDKVRFIKCDVEGHELQVFQGAMNILHKSRPFILAEVNVSRDDLFDFFYNLEYLAYYFNGTHLIRTENKHDKYINYFFIPKEKIQAISHLTM